MRLTFKPAEAAWIREAVKRMLSIALELEPSDVRALMRMRYKTEGVPTQIFMVEQERNIIGLAAEMRAKRLDLQDDEELTTVKGILETLKSCA